MTGCCAPTLEDRGLGSLEDAPGLGGCGRRKSWRAGAGLGTRVARSAENSKALGSTDDTLRPRSWAQDMQGERSCAIGTPPPHTCKNGCDLPPPPKSCGQKSPESRVPDQRNGVHPSYLSRGGSASALGGSWKQRGSGGGHILDMGGCPASRCRGGKGTQVQSGLCRGSARGLGHVPLHLSFPYHGGDDRSGGVVWHLQGARSQPHTQHYSCYYVCTPPTPTPARLPWAPWGTSLRPKFKSVGGSVFIFKLSFSCPSPAPGPSLGLLSQDPEPSGCPGGEQGSPPPPFPHTAGTPSP